MKVKQMSKGPVVAIGLGAVLLGVTAYAAEAQQKSNFRENIWRLSHCLATLLLMIWLPAAIQAAPGDLDPSFGNGGKVITEFGGGIGSANNTNGSLDTTFGTGGIVVTPIGSDRGFANAVAIQSNGKIVVAGGNGRWESNVDFALARYSTDGSLDTSFGSGGIVVTPIGNGNESAIAVAIQPDGRIVAVGNSNNGTNGNFALVQYLGDSASPNPIDDPQFFVRQQYRDFLNR